MFLMIAGCLGRGRRGRDLAHRHGFLAILSLASSRAFGHADFVASP